MVMVNHEGMQVLVVPKLRVEWGPLESEVREQVPPDRILTTEKIVLNARMQVIDLALDELTEFAELMEELTEAAGDEE